MGGAPFQVFLIWNLKLEVFLPKPGRKGHSNTRFCFRAAFCLHLGDSHRSRSQV